VNRTPTIIAAQRGDARATEALVSDSQDIVYAMARSRVGSAEVAQEIAQEALIEVWTQLHTLREPKAYLGWVRRIVRKHADRRTRRPRRDTEGLPERLPGVEPQALLSLTRQERRRALRAALATLPARERAVVSLYYLSGHPLRELEHQLGVPVGTLKKRLHTARKRLRAGMEDLMRDELSNERPSRDQRLLRQVKLFIAAREGDLRAVRAVLTADPMLVQGATALDSSDVEQGRLAQGGRSPLHVAVTHGHDHVVKALLGAGADPDRPAAGGLTPLHQAARRGDLSAVRHLLAAGAAVDALHDHGLRPLHLAEMRGHDAVAAALLRAGASPTAQDWSTGWREREHAAVQDSQASVLWTGIKAIDLLAPVPVGGVVHLQAGPDRGLTVLMAELIHGLAGLQPVMAIHGEAFLEAPDFRAFLAEAGVADQVRVVGSGVGASASELLDVLRAALAMESQLVFVDHAFTRLGEAKELLESASATVVLFEHLPSDGTPGMPELDAVLVLDEALAQSGRFPAVDRARSRSTADVPALHSALAVRVTRAQGQLGERLQAYLTQPFFVYETWTGVMGKRVSPENTLRDVRALVDGEVDAPPEELLYRGGLKGEP